MEQRYDAFISYSTKNADVANELVEKIEAEGKRCFIAPRDIAPGALYAQEIVRGVREAEVFIFLFSAFSNKSYYCCSEANAAVSEGKRILTIGLDRTKPSDALHFYLGPSQWIDAARGLTDEVMKEVFPALTKTPEEERPAAAKEKRDYAVPGPALLEVRDLDKIGLDLRGMIIKEMEIDYLCIPADRYHIDASTEGSLDDWLSGAHEFGSDTSVMLVKNDEIIGYCDIRPIAPQYYPDLIAGKTFIRDYMIDIFCMGGDFDAYISMIGIVPQEESQRGYRMLFTWLFRHLDDWEHEDIHVHHVGLSVYSDVLEKFALRLGFAFRSLNPGGGKVYEADMETLKQNPFVKRIAPHLSEAD